MSTTISRKRLQPRRVLAGVFVLLFVLLALTRDHAPVAAQTGGAYDLTWSTIDGGGVTFASGGNYLLSGTIGQPDTGALSGGSYTLTGGFWSGAGPNNRLYLPLIVR